MKRPTPLKFAIVCCVFTTSLAWGSPHTIAGVPAYNWYHGCGPTAAASVLGYWDLHGYPDLFTASGNAVYLTANVQDQISSPEHNAKYDPTPDDPNLPTPPMTSIADWFRTSVDPQGYGWSYLSNSPAAFSGYAAYRGYAFHSWYSGYGAGLSWTGLTEEVDAGRPLMFLVDSDGDGSTDHFVPVFGYDDRGTSGQWYGCYNTWHEAETIDWYRFHPMTYGDAWGVGYATFALPVPEPSVLACAASLLVVLRLSAMRRRW